jgi:glycosyltransferase involved in cell wall biosynthesis
MTFRYQVIFPMDSIHKPRCSIVIRCFNEEQHIGKLLKGISQQSIKGVEIVLVDSGSTDGTLRIASKYPVKIVHIHPEDFSFGRALNRGCEAATADFIVMASAHVFPIYNDWLDKLLCFFQDEKVGLVYGKQRGNELTKYSENQIFAHWFPEKSNSHQSYPFCNNANAAIRRSLWEQLPYDEELTGLEDLDWAKRAIAMRFKIAYEAEAEIIHVHDENYANIFNRYRREALALKQIIPDDRFSLGDFTRLFLINSWNDVFHAWREGLFTKAFASIIAFRFMQFWGTYRGFSQRGPITNRLKQRFYYPNNWREASRTVNLNDAGRRIDYTIKLKEEI